MNRSAEYRVGIGASSILMIFVVLCLTTLGVLSFASARANLNLTTRRQAQIEAYYGAAAEAQALLAAIDGRLAAMAQAGEEITPAALRRLTGLDDAIRVSPDGTVSFSLAVGDAQSLEVALTAQPSADSPRYTLLRHQLTYTGEWVPDTSINLMTEPLADD